MNDDESIARRVNLARKSWNSAVIKLLRADCILIRDSDPSCPRWNSFQSIAEDIANTPGVDHHPTAKSVRQFFNHEKASDDVVEAVLEWRHHNWPTEEKRRSMSSTAGCGSSNPTLPSPPSPVPPPPPTGGDVVAVTAVQKNPDEDPDDDPDEAVQQALERQMLDVLDSITRDLEERMYISPEDQAEALAEVDRLRSCCCG